MLDRKNSGLLRGNEGATIKNPNVGESSAAAIIIDERLLFVVIIVSLLSSLLYAIKKIGSLYRLLCFALRLRTVSIVAPIEH